jgi:hypothetical protein
MGLWIQTSNFVFFIVNGLIKGEIEKPTGQYIGFICDESLTCHAFNLNPGNFDCFTYKFVPCLENRICLSRGVQEAGVA